VHFGEVLLPHGRALARVEAAQVAHGPERVDLAAGDDGRGPGAGRVRDFVGARVLALPRQLAVGHVEAQDALLAGQGFAGETALGVLHPLVEDAVGDVDLAAGDRGPGVAHADVLAPADLGPALGELGQDAGFPPDAVALGPQPLRPVVRPQG